MEINVDIDNIASCDPDFLEKQKNLGIKSLIMIAEGLQEIGEISDKGEWLKRFSM
jgi:hypothetical protein